MVGMHVVDHLDVKPRLAAVRGWTFKQLYVFSPEVRGMMRQQQESSGPCDQSVAYREHITIKSQASCSIKCLFALVIEVHY